MVIPFFIPHFGCPHICLFCNQNTISGGRISLERILAELEHEIKVWLLRKREGERVQLAFYGGSFSCLEQETQFLLLHAVKPYLDREQIHSVRISTRPDCISRDSCRFLKENGVATVELGIQSMDDRVLALSRRGHTSEQSLRALSLLQEEGFETGIQLLPGLPGESRFSFLKGVKALAAAKPDMARLYPALVINRSGLADLYRRGAYTPLSLELAVLLCRRAKEILTAHDVKVIRMGLQDSKMLKQEYLAGPHHPSFGELVLARDWFRRVRQLLSSSDGMVDMRINPKDISAFNGHKRWNIRRLESLELAGKMKLHFDESVERGRIKHAVSK